MLRSTKDLRGYAIRATDGDIGKVHEFLFDDLAWIVRYLVVDTGNWLPGRQVLLWPGILGQPDWGTQSLPVGLTKEQVEHSPHISSDEPVSRQMETDLHTYYGWTPYWRGGLPVFGLGAAAAAEMIAHTAEEKDEEEEQESDPHLRSTREVIGYHIQARDGEIGHVEDFVIYDESWFIRYLVINTRNWLPGRKVLVAPAWAEQVNWVERKVYVDLGRETIKNSPEFDPSMPINREYEVRLYDYYGRPKYWV
jgi:stress response protein YsnF